MWKLGLNNLVVDTQPASNLDSYYSRFEVHLAYEHQLGSPAWSVLGEVSPTLAFYRLSVEHESERELSVRTQLAGRYYYNLELRLGRRTDGFSANYFSLALGAGLGQRAHDTPFYLFRGNHGRLVTPDVALLYGIQRRLGRRGFIDANVGLASLLLANTEHADVTIRTSLRVGLLLGSPLSTPARPVLADAAESLWPHWYVGVGVGVYGYQVRYSTQYPYPPNVDLSTPQGGQRVHYGPYYGQYGEGYDTYRDYQTAI